MTADSSDPWTVLRLLEWTREYFDRARLTDARLTAEVLLAHCLQCERLELYTRFDSIPSEQQRRAFRELVLRAAAHEPAAYLVGRKEFYSLSFKVTPDVLIPRPETEILVEQAVGYLRRLGRRGTMWDVCTGSGCVAIAVAVNVQDVDALATDISPEAVEVAVENVESHALSGRVHCGASDLLSLPEDSPICAPFDVITVNPPYVAEGDEVATAVRHEPTAALYAGPTGMDCISRVVSDAPPMLHEGGALIMEFGCDQGDDVRDLIVRTGEFAEPTIHRDHQGIERAAVAVRR